jgi:hypothetical protein
MQARQVEREVMTAQLEAARAEAQLRLDNQQATFEARLKVF